MEKEKKVDITKFPEGPEEVVKYMDYMPDDHDARMALLMQYMQTAIR